MGENIEKSIYNEQILETPFKHNSLFKGKGMTKREALEELAKELTWYVDKQLKKSLEMSLFNHEYEYFLKYSNSKYRTRYKMSIEEVDFFEERSEFYHLEYERKKAEETEKRNNSSISILKVYDRLYVSWHYEVRNAQSNIDGFMKNNDAKMIELWNDELNYAKMRLQLGMSMFVEYLTKGKLTNIKDFEQFQEDFYIKYHEMGLTMFEME